MKIQRGDHTCDLDRFYDNITNLPFESVTLKCSYQNTNYAAIKCDYNGLCDYAKQIDMDDIREAPELFENNIELYGEE